MEVPPIILIQAKYCNLMVAIHLRQLSPDRHFPDPQYTRSAESILRKEQRIRCCLSNVYGSIICTDYHAELFFTQGRQLPYIIAVYFHATMRHSIAEVPEKTSLKLTGRAAGNKRRRTVRV